jgi:hypothetical protein
LSRGGPKKAKSTQAKVSICERFNKGIADVITLHLEHAGILATPSFAGERKVRYRQEYRESERVFAKPPNPSALRKPVGAHVF